MWRVGMSWEILFYEERSYQTADEINEMNALGRLKETLKKLGGVENFEFDENDNYTGEQMEETVNETEVEIEKTVTVSLTAEIAKNVVDFINACDNQNDNTLKAILTDWQGGKVLLPQPCAQRLVIILALLVQDYYDSGIEMLSPKARFVYTRDAVTKALVKAGVIQDSNWWQ
jgi:hypothetical protein